MTIKSTPRYRHALTMLTLLAMLCGLISLPSYVQAAPLAGNIISNMAVGEYREEGSNVIQTSRSNLVQTTIIPVYTFSLTQDRSLPGVSGQTVFFQHELTNTGNAPDSYNLSTINLTSDNFDYSNIRIYIDANRDGIPDGPAVTNYKLGAGETTGIIVGADIPASMTTVKNTAQLRLTATSQADSTKTLSNTDTVTMTDQALVLVRKAFSFNTAAANSFVRVRIDYENRGSLASGVVTLTDVLNNSQLTYQAGNETWNGTAVNPANGNDDPAGINYYVTNNTVTAVLTSVPANSSGYIQFDVKVNQTAAGNINNIVGLSYDHDNNPATAPVADNSNTAVLKVTPAYNVVINAIASSASQAAADNLAIVTASAAGSEVTFADYIWNTGNSEDRFNLTFANDNFPTPHQIAYYRADGVTPLLDTNGDGIVDTGTMAAGQSMPVVVKVRFPAGVTVTNNTNYSVFPTATSVGDNSKTDTVENRATLTATSNASLVDLTNGPETSNNGLGNGNSTNNGQPWKTLTANSGGQVIFPLAIKHTGAPTAYTLSTDGNGDFNSVDLPNGVASVRYFATTTADCSQLGQEINQSRLLNNGEVQLYCAVVTLQPTASTSTAVPIYFKAASTAYANGTANPGFDTITNAININNVNSSGVIKLSPDLRGQIAVNGTIVYTHLLQNQTASDYTIPTSFTVSNDKGDFSSTLYLDSNNNGRLDNADILIKSLADLPGGKILANSQLTIFHKLQHSGSANVGQVDLSTIKLVNNIGNMVSQVQDTTTLSVAQIRLTKLQAKDDDCNGIADSAYTTATLPIGKNANGSGQCVLYRLTVSNQGTDAIGAFNFHDATPAYTVMSTAPTCNACTANTITAPAQGQTGTLAGTVPAVASGMQYNYEFGVRYVGP